VQGLAQALGGAEQVSILVTHAHPDHAPAARTLAAALAGSSARVRVLGPRSLADATPLAPGDAVPTDHGELFVVDTPGHAREHLAFHWPQRRALFAGDLLLGRGNTVWVGEYAGCVADYLESLERVRRLRLRVIYPAHGPPLEDPEEALARFEAHRRERIRQVRDALAARPGADAETLLAEVYGPALPESARRAALKAMEALKAHVEGRRA
jgi:glyoxylase-like metal-dependent hydrolase (beta-lactamase superfamily II)